MVDEYLRPDADTALDGWTDQAGGTTSICTTLDETSAGDSDYVQSPVIAALQADLVVRLMEGASEIVEWTHTDISETFATAEQTLTSPQLAAITDFNNLYLELDDNAGSVYRTSLGNPAGVLTTPVVVRYRYKKWVAASETTSSAVGAASGIGAASGVGSTGGGAAATTWNASDKTANMVLSSSDTVATATGGNAQGVRSVATVVANQKVYIEFVPSVNANNQQFGFARSTHVLAGGVGQEGTSFGVEYTGIYKDQSSADHNAAMPSWTTGNNVGIAYDDATKRFWSRVNGGAWSNSGDPAAGTGGRIVAVTGTLYAVLSIAYDTEYTTTKFASSSWTYSAPSGFTELA